MQSADLLLFPDSETPIRLMLERDRSGARLWQRQRVRRHPPAIEGAHVESSLVWVTWHLGDGYSRITGTGLMPPTCAEGDADTTHTALMRLPEAVQTVAPGTITNVQWVFTYGGRVWAVGYDGTGDAFLWSVNLAGAVQSTTKLADTPITSLANPVIFDGSVYIAVKDGSVEGAWKIPTSLTPAFTSFAPTWNRAVVARDRLWIALGSTVKSIASAANPLVPANHSGAIQVGDTSHPVLWLDVMGRVLYIGRQDGLIGLDTELNQVNCVPDLQAYVNAENCAVMTPWHGGLVFPHIRGMFYYVEGLVAPIGFDRTRMNGTRLRGRVSMLVADGEYLWAKVATEAGVEMLVRGRERAEGESEVVQTPVVWQVVAIGAMHTPFMAETGTIVTDTASTALYFPFGGKLARLPLAHRQGYPAALTAPVEAFAPNAHKVLPAADAGAPLVPKYLRSVEIDLQNGALTRTATASYAAEPDMAEPVWTEIGTAAAEGLTTLELPPSVLLREVQFRLDLHGDAQSSPVVRRFAANYLERSPKSDVFIGTALVGPVVDREGDQMEAAAQDVLGRLYAIDKDTVVPAIDPDGNEVNLLILEIQEGEVEQKADQPAVKRVVMTVEVVP